MLILLVLEVCVIIVCGCIVEVVVRLDIRLVSLLLVIVNSSSLVLVVMFSGGSIGVLGSWCCVCCWDV